MDVVTETRHYLKSKNIEFSDVTVESVISHYILKIYGQNYDMIKEAAKDVIEKLGYTHKRSYATDSISKTIVNVEFQNKSIQAERIKYIIMIVLFVILFLIVTYFKYKK